MAKETTTSCKTKTKKRKKTISSSSSSWLSSRPVFSDLEINAAEQLIQLSSGDSELSNRNDIVVALLQVEYQPAMSDTTPYDLISTASNDDDHDPTTIFEIGPPRKHKRFKSLGEIYNLTNPLSIVS
ncbi:hypothetical protein CsatB_015171 [Cannabis sativa]|uniref:Uncharacterized protein n=1 Tax=Cannabis sativa TaxID=3483 RepID=A0A803Q8D1_CANSA